MSLVEWQYYGCVSQAMLIDIRVCVVTSQCQLSPSKGSSSLAVLVAIQMVLPYSSGTLFETTA